MVDYVLATQNPFDHIEYMKEYDPNILSDHCLISFGLSMVLQVSLFVLFDLILYVHSTIFQLCGTVLPGFNQY